MATARNTDFTLVDYSDEINLFPKVWSLISSMNLFEVHNISTTVAQVERVQEVIADIQARARGGERNYIGNEQASTKTFNVPFFPLDKGITAADIQNFREYGSGNTSKTVLSEIARVMRRVRASHAALTEKLMANAIKGVGIGLGSNYDYYADFGVTQHTADVDLTDGAVDPFDTLETEARQYIIKTAQDNTDSFSSYNIVGICGSEYFTNMVNHELVREAYVNYESQQEPLRRRLGMGEENTSVRVFRHKGITLIEDLSGNFAETEAYFFPLGMPDMFRVYYSPADDAQYANTNGQELYLWYKEDSFHRDYKVESETSVLCVPTRPELIVKSIATV